MKFYKDNQIIKLIIWISIITVCMIILMNIQLNKQYKYINEITNRKIISILENIKEDYTELDSEQIIKILRSDNDYDSEVKTELEKYGLDLGSQNVIKQIESNFLITSMKMGLILVTLAALLSFFFFLCLYNKKRKVNEIIKYIHKIERKNYELNIDENSEDELSYLKNELYKITVMLKQESENSMKDKETLKILVQDISHQLKTPLTSISIILDNLIENPEMDKETRKRFIFEINKQIEWINWLVISMLKMSRLEADVAEFKKENINVKSFINACIEKLEIPIEIKNQNIVISGNEDIEFVGDYKWEQEAFNNIIKNCIEHTEPNKSIYIHFLQNSIYTKISIKDEGEGIHKKDLRHIFERFYKCENSSEKSVGIGLALAKSIIEKDNGLISCYSKIGVGTEFVIKFMK